MNVAQRIDELISQNIEDRSERISVIDAFLESLDERPEPHLLERLTDYILREELTDRHPDKITRTEYPFMSDWQLELRRDKEVPLKAVEEHGTDGRNYREHKRRKRHVTEGILVDMYARSRNKDRRSTYREFTKDRPVTTYYMTRERIDAYLRDKYPNKRLI